MVVCATSALATTLSATFNVDNGFFAYISTDDGVQGTEFLSGESWPTSFSGSVSLTAGVTNYLHVRAYDTGGAAAFMGTFSLSDTGFAFGNGTQSLVTGEGYFQQSTTGWGSYGAVTDHGGHGSILPDWFRPAQADAARFIWSADNAADNEVYFTAAITAAAVPVPASLPLLIGALGVFGLLRRRSR